MDYKLFILLFLVFVKYLVMDIIMNWYMWVWFVVNLSLFVD